MIMKKKTLAGIFLALVGVLLITGCVSTIESKADDGDINSMKKMARLYNGERVFVYNPEDELPILGAFTEAVVGKPAKDVTKSFTWMKRAAEKDDIAAMIAVGQYYGEGFGTEISFKDSAIWFDKALKATSSKQDENQQPSFDEICQTLVLWFDNNLTSANVSAYYDVLLQIKNYINPEMVCRMIAYSSLSFAEKIKLMDSFSKEFKYSPAFAKIVNEEIFDYYFKSIYNASKHQKLFDSRSGVPINLLFCGDYNIAEQLIKEKKLPDRFAKSSLLNEKEIPLLVTDRGTFFGARNGNHYFMVDIPDEELSNLYEYTPPLSADERIGNFFSSSIGLGSEIIKTPIVVFSNDFDENNFLYPEMYMFGERKRITGVKVEDIIEKLKSDYNNLTVKNLSEDKVTKIIIGTAYRVTYRPVGFRLENDDVFLTVKSEKEIGLLEPKLEKIKPEDSDYQFALMNAKIHGGFSCSELKGYSQKDKDKIHQEENKEFEEFFNRDLDVDDIEKQLKEYGVILSIDYNSSNYKENIWHNVMESKKNYRLESPKSLETDGVIDMAISSIMANFIQMQAQFAGQQPEESVVIIECFDKALYDKAIEQYPKIHNALAQKAEMKKQKEYDDNKKEQLNF